MQKSNELTTNRLNWNYETSVEVAKKHVKLLKRRTLELVRELYAAHENLDPRERTATGQFCPMGKSWQNYCDDIGLSKRTANSWLALYLPDEDRLMTTEEFKQRLIDSYEALIAQLDMRYPSFRPEGWNDRVEAYWQKKQKLMQLQQLAARPVSEIVDPQPSLFDDSFLDSLKVPSSEEIVRFGQLKSKAESYVVPGVDEHQQIKALSFIEATVRQFPAQSRRDIIRSLASMMLEILLNEEDF